MAITERKVLKNIREDPETKKETRTELTYLVTVPDNFNPAQPHGVVFCITGFGDTADSDYQINKLRPYIADKYNMLTVGVRYHNDARVDGRYDINLVELGRFFGVGDGLAGMQGNWDSVAMKIFELMITNQVRQLPIYLAPKTGAYQQYSSFGFLPAVDHLDVLYDLSRQYEIDKKRIVAMGAGYGGYIASLAAKLAPFTFSQIIDVSGYCMTELSEVFGGLIGRASMGFNREIEGERYTIPLITGTIWSVDELSEYYFSDAHRQIRNLLNQSHRVTSPTVHCHYHSIEDSMSPIDLKDRYCSILDKYNPVYYRRIEEEDVDGELFKNLAHCMDVSLEKIFDQSVEKYLTMPLSKGDDIDFDRNVSYSFPCSDKLYNFTYTEAGLDVQIKPVYL